MNGRITILDRTLGLRINLGDVPFGASLAADDGLPVALHRAAKRLHAALLTRRARRQ